MSFNLNMISNSACCLKSKTCIFFKGIEKGLLEQITYLTEVATGQPHEGSVYGAEKVRNWIAFMSCMV